MKNKDEEKNYTASENEDGTFSISGTDHKNLSYEELNKVMDLQGGFWLIFRNYGSKSFPNAKHLDFAGAM